MTLEIPLPEPFASTPRYTLTLGPSPIHPLPNTSADLHATIYAKREDLNSALAYGGNKTRKLEYLLADALAQNATTLLSIGGVQSNHTRQVAAAAAHAGLTARLVQEHWVDWKDAHYDRVGNIQLSRLMGADVRLHPAGFGIEHKESLKQLMGECEARGERAYYIPAGASDHPLGGLGFARWAFEVAMQEREMGVFFDVVVVCAVTGSTFAGMVAGFKLLERMEPGSRKRRVIGIDASARPAETRAQVLRIARGTAAKIGLKEEDISEEDVVLDENYHEGVYGVPGEGTIKAMEYAASKDAFITDPVYEGKSFAGLIDLAKKGEFAGKTVLYAHLGGQPALNAYSEIGRAK